MCTPVYVVHDRYYQLTYNSIVCKDRPVVLILT